MKRTRMLPVILCVAVVVVAAALVWHRQTAQPVLDPLLAETLSVSDQEQKSLSNAVQTIDQTDSADGLTVTVKQAITYPQMLCLLVELTYPDPIDPATLPEDDSILPSSYTVTVNDPTLDVVSYTVHCRIPEEGGWYSVWMEQDDGTWVRQDSTKDGSYLLFPATAQSVTFCLIQEPGALQLLVPIGILVAGLLFLLWYRKKAKKKATEGEKAEKPKKPRKKFNLRKKK